MKEGKAQLNSKGNIFQCNKQEVSFAIYNSKTPYLQSILNSKLNPLCATFVSKIKSFLNPNATIFLPKAVKLNPLVSSFVPNFWKKVKARYYLNPLAETFMPVKSLKVSSVAKSNTKSKFVHPFQF